MRLVDADKLIEDIYSNAYACTNDEINKILHKQLETNINVINNQPTAYDVAKVIKQLEERLFSAEVYNDDLDGCDIDDLLCMGDVIEIVEVGGIDD